MDWYEAKDVRNVALAGHGGSGKTTLAEALAFHAGVIPRAGTVEDGNTISDFEPEETKRRMSISAALASFPYRSCKLNILDAPGFPDFSHEMAAAIGVAEMVVIVVSGVEGVEVQTETAWRLAAGAGIPRMFFISKLDRDRSSFERTVSDLRQTFGAGVAPMELPIGDEGSFHGVADLLTDTAYTYADGRPSAGPVPDELAEIEHRVHDNLVEGIVVADDALTERYLEGDVPAAGELAAALGKGVAEATVFPIVCGSAPRGIGVDRLADLICEIGPSPLQRPATMVRAGDTTTEVPCDPDGRPLALVFKTMSDPYIGRISLLKVLSGTLQPDIVLSNPRAHCDERLHMLQAMRGKESEPVPRAVAGDVIAVPKLAHTATGDTLAPKGAPVMIDAPEAEEPSLSTAVKPRSTADEDKLMNALNRMQEEDPALRVRRVDETHQTILSGNGEAHLTVTFERLQRKFGVEVTTEDLLVPYRETITQPAEAEGKYKKQTGGHGQFGVASIRVAPLERGAGFRFSDEIVGGAIPRQFIPAVEKGVRDALDHVGAFGYPVCDIHVTCYDGKHHPVDSSEMSFKMAGSLALKEAVAKAHPVLLEPISRIEVTMPPEHQGEVLGDLSSRRARVQGTETTDEGWHTVIALVPTSEVLRYAIDLRSLTGGRGRFRISHDHYDVAPSHVAEKLAKTPSATGSGAPGRVSGH